MRHTAPSGSFTCRGPFDADCRSPMAARRDRRRSLASLGQPGATHRGAHHTRSFAGRWRLRGSPSGVRRDHPGRPAGRDHPTLAGAAPDPGPDHPALTCTNGVTSRTVCPWPETITTINHRDRSTQPDRVLGAAVDPVRLTLIDYSWAWGAVVFWRSLS